MSLPFGLDSYAAGVANSIKGYFSIGNPDNSLNNQTPNNEEGVHNNSDTTKVLTIDKPDSELLEIARDFEKNSKSYYEECMSIADTNKNYYLGTPNSTSNNKNKKKLPTNLIFESLETVIPSILSKEPTPVTYPVGQATDLSQEYSSSVRISLANKAIDTDLKESIQQVIRFWGIYQIGVLKYFWDAKIDDIGIEVINPKNIILSRNHYINTKCEYTGDIIGERKVNTIKKLIELYPNKKNELLSATSSDNDKINDNLGRDITYTIWTTPQFTFLTYEKIVLDKYPNLYFLSDKDIQENQEKGIMSKNHFKYPKMNYSFFNVFSFNDQPHDTTGLIAQSIPNQDVINSRNAQIDFNIKRSNTAIAVAGNFNQEESNQITQGIAAGGNLSIPLTGGIDDVRKAVTQFPPIPLTDGHFRNLETNKQDLRTIFGVTGLAPVEQKPNVAVRGQVFNQGKDKDRINGGIGERLENFCEQVYNWYYQLMCVYYTDQREFSAQLEGDVEYGKLSQNTPKYDIIITVAPDSLVPKDQISEANQAIALFEKQALDLETLYKKLDIPNPRDLAGKVLLYNIDKIAYLSVYYPDVYQAMLQSQQVQAVRAGPVIPGGEEQLGGGSSTQLPQGVSDELGVQDIPTDISGIDIPKLPNASPNSDL